jgi:potassium-transporting ATPase ATP-binding subunit
MGRMMQKNVVAVSGRAVEAAGDVDVLLLDKTGTITLGNRHATAFLHAGGVAVQELADAAQLASLADETPEGRSVVVLAKHRFGLRGRDIHALGATFVPFSAHTRMSGVDLGARQIRKGAPRPSASTFTHKAVRSRTTWRSWSIWSHGAGARPWWCRTALGSWASSSSRTS